MYGIKSQEFNLEPPYSSNDYFQKPPGFPDSTPIAKHVPQDQCCDLNIGEEGEIKNIQISKHLLRRERRAWQRFFNKQLSVFAWSYKDLKGVPPEVCKHHIHLEERAKLIHQRQRRLNPKYSLLVKEEIEKLLETGFIYPVPYSEWVSSIVIVPKKNRKIRICQDFRKFNNATKKDYFPLPFTDAILDAVASHECYSFLDGFSGYNQIQIALEDQLKTTFTTTWGTFASIIMLFGLCNAPATFQRVMIVAFLPYLHKFIEIFLDDFCVFGKIADHAEQLTKCFEQCEKYGISLNAAKCQFVVPFGRLLGHIVGKAGIVVDLDKISLIVNFPKPTIVKQVRSYLGLCSYYRRAIKSFAEIASPLTKLLKKLGVGASPIWAPNCEEAFLALKEKLSTTPVFIPPNWNKPFRVYVDASNMALGCVLSQKDDKNFDHPIYFASRQLIADEKNYTTTERKALGMIFAVQKFRHCLLGYPFFFYVNHDALKYLINKLELSGRLACWILLLQEFNFTVVVRPGESHGNANHISRLEPLSPSQLEPLNDQLLDSTLFEVDVIHSEYADILTFLQTNRMPENYNLAQIKSLLQRSSP